MTLDEYTARGGLIERLLLKNVRTTYSDENQNKPIEKIELSKHKGGMNCDLYKVTYTNGKSHRYAGLWIEVSNLKFVLDSRYTT